MRRKIGSDKGMAQEKAERAGQILADGHIARLPPEWGQPAEKLISARAELGRSASHLPMSFLSEITVATPPSRAAQGSPTGTHFSVS